MYNIKGKKKRGRPNSRYMYVVRANMLEVGVQKEDAEDRNWKSWIRCDDPRRPLRGIGEKKK